MKFPSRDHEGARLLICPGVSSTWVPGSSRFRTNTEGLPPRVLINARVLPSGDHDAIWFITDDEVKVSLTAFPPSELLIIHSSFPLRMASLLPSGDQLGNWSRT